MVLTLPLGVLYVFQNKQQISSYTILRDWFCTTEVWSVYCAVRNESSIKQTRFAFKRLGASHRKSRYFESRLTTAAVARRCVPGNLQCQVQLQNSPCSASSYFTLLWYQWSRVSTYTECNQREIVGRIPRKSTEFFSTRRIYRVIQNDCRGFNDLSYTIHLR